MVVEWRNAFIEGHEPLEKLSANGRHRRMQEARGTKGGLKDGAFEELLKV